MTDQPDPDSEMLGRLGEMGILWAYVEHWLGELLCALLEANPALMPIVTGNVSASTVADWIRTLLQARHDTESASEDILELLKQIDELRAERNSLTHGLWMFGEPGTATVQTIRWERSEIIKQELVTLADLEELVMATRQAKLALEALGRKHGFPVMPE